MAQTVECTMSSSSSKRLRFTGFGHHLVKYYHRFWQGVDPPDNFFKWLDRGSGKYLSLPQCPRERLEKTIICGSPGLNYMVKIDEQGKLRWTRNNEFVDTTAGHWKYEDRGEGIVPEDMPDRPVVHPRHSFDSAVSSSPSSSVSSDENYREDNTDAVEGSNVITKAFEQDFTPSGVLDKMLRKTVKRNIWIYVSDKHFNIFIGIKATGQFQLSSLLGGGMVTSAGLIPVYRGVIHNISPLSGHYRTSVSHFKRFINVLEERGVDMSKADISKEEFVLWGSDQLLCIFSPAKLISLERVGKVKKAKNQVVSSTKHKLKGVIGATNVTHENEQWIGSSWKAEILEGRKGSAKQGRQQAERGQYDQDGTGMAKRAEITGKLPQDTRDRSETGQASAK